MGLYRNQSIHILPTLGLNVCKYYLLTVWVVTAWGLYLGHMGIMEKKTEKNMETIIMGLYRVWV